MALPSLLRAFRPESKSPSLPPVRIAVIGAGRMGQYHAKHLSQNRRAQLVGIVDTDASRVQTTARRFRTQAFQNVSELFGKIDAAVIATPTPSHYHVGKLLLGARVSCLIEKPLAANLAEAEELITLAEKHKRVLQVGHIERFNPAVIEAARHIHAPQFIEVNRLGPYDPRVADIGVVMDLMIHDLDIVLFLVGEEATRVEAFGARVLSNHEDIAKVRLHFKNGCIADLSASRVSLKKYRRIRIFQKDAYLSLDYADQKLMVYRKKSAVVKSLTDIQALRPRLKKGDPLALELAHFLQCVQEGTPPMVSGKHGRDALQLAREVLNNLKVHA